MILMLHRTLLALTFLVLAAAPSQAALIDFTDEAAWGGADGVNWLGFTSSVLYDGVSVTVTSASASQFMTFNDEGALFEFACSLATGGALACDGDGLGIGDDEIGYGYPSGEGLFVFFSQPVDVTRLGFLDLYRQGGSDPSAEVARFAAITSSGGFFEDALTGTGSAIGLGLAVADFNVSGVVAMLFFTNSPAPSNSDFALAAIEMTPTVPEPATLLLMGTGLALVARRARRRRA